ncbi:cytochrome P450 [Tsukamurella ocularis]|uniref:cytochrome P450 n=1 Tax=Tsukamurella ocularis TaxID=1970234 RepID=UPI0039F1128F
MTNPLPTPPRRLPILGDVLTVTRHNPVTAEASMFGELGVPVFERVVGPSRLVMVGGGAAAHEVCDEATWSHATLGPAQYFRRYVPTGLFTAANSDPLWHAAREVLTPAFSREAMIGYHSTMRDVSDGVIDRWLAHGALDDVTAETTKLTVEIIGRIGFGTDVGVLEGDLRDSETYRSLETVLQWGNDTANSIPVVGLPRKILQTRRTDRAAAQLRGFADDLIARRRADGATVTDGASMLDRMLSVPDSHGDLLPDANIAENVITLLIAGHETTAALLSTALFYLARTPELQETLRAEVREATSDGWSYEGVNRMRGIASVLQESLRVHPPAPAIFRIAKQDTTVGGHPVARGSVALLVLIAVHTDASVWGPDADRFDGLRFTTKTPPGVFHRPWGVGPRSCIGRQFAQHEAAVMLARLLDRARLLPGGGPADRPEMLERGLMRPGPHRVVLEPL